jgi:hypothetical protein
LLTLLYALPYLLIMPKGTNTGMETRMSAGEEEILHLQERRVAFKTDAAARELVLVSWYRPFGFETEV